MYKVIYQKEFIQKLLFKQKFVRYSLVVYPALLEDKNKENPGSHYNVDESSYSSIAIPYYSEFTSVRSNVKSKS